MSHVRAFFPQLLALILALGFITFDSSDAHAKRGIAIINTGEQIFHVGPFPEAVQAPDQNLQVAVLCGQFGLFWAAVWTYDCRFVAFIPSEQAYADIPPEILPEVEKKYDFSDGQRDLWNKYGIVVLILLLALFAYLKLREDHEVPDYNEDPDQYEDLGDFDHFEDEKEDGSVNTQKTKKEE